MADFDPEKRPICFEEDGLYPSMCLAGLFCLNSAQKNCPYIFRAPRSATGPTAVPSL